MAAGWLNLLTAIRQMCELRSDYCELSILRVAIVNGAQRAVLADTDAMTREVHVSEAVFDALRPHFPPRQIVELTATVAAGNLVSRFLEALAVDPEAAHARVRPLPR